MAIEKQKSDNTLNFKTTLFFALWSLFLGVVIRYPYLVVDDAFPLGDGGLFVVMINAIKANHYLPPESVFYNSFQIPFAYPPLGFYLTIFASQVTGMSTLSTMRFLPLAFNVLTIIAFAFLASEFAKDRVELFTSTTLFPIIFQSYEWFIKGGGITRSPSLFFMVLTLLFLVLHQKHGKLYYFILVIGSLSASVLSHAEWGLIAVASVIAYLLTHDLRNWRRNMLLLVTMGISTLVLTSPWWLTAMSRFGLVPFLTASQSIESGGFLPRLFDARIFAVTVTLYDSYLIPVFAISGVIISLLRRNFFFLAWLVSICIVNSRNSPGIAVVPVAILAAVGLRGIDQFLAFLLSALRNEDNQSPAWQVFTVRFPISYVYIIALLVLLSTSWEHKPLIHSISQVERGAMRFIKENTPVDAKFVVLTPYDWFAADEAEWFPYLAERHSLTTPQGLEWVSSSTFIEIASIVDGTSTLIQNELIGSENETTICQYAESRFPNVDYVVLFVNNIDSDFGGCLESGKYGIFYHKKDVLIFSALRTP